MSEMDSRAEHVFADDKPIHGTWVGEEPVPVEPLGERPEQREQPTLKEDLHALMQRIAHDPLNIAPQEVARFSDVEQQRLIMQTLVEKKQWHIACRVLADPAWKGVDRTALVTAMIEDGATHSLTELIESDTDHLISDEVVIAAVAERRPENAAMVQALLRLLRALSEADEGRWTLPQYSQERIDHMHAVLAEARMAMHAFIERCGVDARWLLDQWRANDAHPLEYSNQTGPEFARLMSNIGTMMGIESKQPGGVRRLANEYGITMYGRYGADVLLKQLEQSSDTTTPYGVMIFPKSDHNGAFYEYGSDIAYQQEQLAKLGHNLRIIEVGSKLGLLRRVVQLNRRFNQSGQNRIDFAILAGHGDPISVRFGSDDRTGNATLTVNDMLQLQFPKNQKPKFAPQHEAYQQFIQCFDPDIDVALISCSTAGDAQYGMNVAWQMSRMVGGQVTGPTESTGMSNLLITKVNGKIRLDPYYALGRRRYQAGTEVPL